MIPNIKSQAIKIVFKEKKNLYLVDANLVISLYIVNKD